MEKTMSGLKALKLSVFCVVLGVGCAKDSSNQTNPSAADSSNGLPPGLHGLAPQQARPAPEFTAVNSDGAIRDMTALIGQPTVMWFFPMANTYG